MKDSVSNRCIQALAYINIFKLTSVQPSDLMIRTPNFSTRPFVSKVFKNTLVKQHVVITTRLKTYDLRTRLFMENSV